MIVDEIIDKYALQLAEGKVEFSDLDAILAKHGVLLEERDHIKSIIDDKSQQLLFDNSSSIAKNGQFVQGVIILSIGVILTLMSLFDIGLFEESNVVFLFPGLIGYGGFSIFRSTQEQEEEINPKKKMKRYFEK